MKLSIRLISGFMTVAGLTLVVGMVGWRGIRQMEATLSRVVQLDDVEKTMLQREIDHLNWVRKASAFLSDEGVTSLSVEKDPHKCGFGSWYYSDARRQAEAAIPAIAVAMKQIEEPHSKLHQSAGELETLLKKGSGGRKEATDYFTLQVGEHLKQVQAQLAEIRKTVQESTQTARTAAVLQEKRAIGLSVGGMVVGTFLALTLGIYLSVSLSRLLRRVSRTLSVGAEHTSASSGQVAAASQSVAEGASEQAASLEEASASLEEMASMTQRNSLTAGKVRDLGSQVRSASDAGMQDVGELTAAMGAIKSSSDDISKIIKAIDEIAFQTNILALNAAVEAARAGEAGMGFGVVAEEVRNLAHRAAKAAEETSVKIESALAKSACGEEISIKVAKRLEQIVKQARQVDELAAEVAAASREQSKGIEQLNEAISQMDQVTQSNAAGAEESAAAAAELNAQAGALTEAVGELFKLVEGERLQVSERSSIPSMGSGDSNSAEKLAAKSKRSGSPNIGRRCLSSSERPRDKKGGEAMSLNEETRTSC